MHRHGLFRGRQGALARRTRLLEATVAERTAELRQKAQQLEVANRGLLAANQELDALSHSVSHDLRAPLRAIKGFTRILEEDYGHALDAEGQRLLGVVCQSADRMSHLLDDLLKFSRTSRAELAFDPLDMKAIAQSAFEEIAGAPDGAARIDFRLGELPPAYGDAALVRHVWMSLLSNAVKYSSRRQRPMVAVEASTEGGLAVYRVRDNGAGFDMAHSGKLFGVFQRLHGEREFEGTGIGLALVKRIVTRHGGRVWAEGAVDQGATFSFTLAPAP